MICWYWVNILNSGLNHYLVYAKSKRHAIKKVTVSRQRAKATEASWRSIQMSTGCRIPFGLTQDSIATTNIPFTTDTMDIRIWAG